MRMQELVGVAEKLGIKINTKAAKSAAIEKIMKAEATAETAAKPTVVPEKIKTKNEFLNAVSDILDGKAIIAPAPETSEPVPAPSAMKPERKRGAKIEYNGKAQNICAWAKELGVSANTLYSRIYILEWDIEKAFTHKGKKS